MMNNLREEYSWIKEVGKMVYPFLNELKEPGMPGFYHYSLRGDLYSPFKYKWGLGNTVFAIKIYHTLNLLNRLPKEEKEAMADFIKSFQEKDGTIYDRLIKRKTFLREKLSSLKNWDFTNVLHQRVIKAETRQAISALNVLGKKPDISYKKFPKNEKEITKYLLKLNWQRPWAAGSHFSHLIFFLRNGDLENKEELIDFAIGWVSRLQNPKDGSWYKGNPSVQQKVNGGMKIITGLKIADKISFQYPERLIDLCLSAINNKHACDNFNVIYVLHYANKVAESNYRFDEVKKFALKTLQIYKKYHFPEVGGFSFLPNKSNVYYYGAKISRGLNEPDIHGTCMFLWGISIINQILGIDRELGFKEVVP